MQTHFGREYLQSNTNICSSVVGGHHLVILPCWYALLKNSGSFDFRLYPWAWCCQGPVKSIAGFEVLGMYFGSYYCACNLWCNSLIDCSYLEIMRLLFYHRGTFQTIPFMLFLVSCGLSWRIVRTVTNSTSLESYHLYTSLVQPIPCFAWSFCEPPLQDRVFLPKPSIAIIYSIPHRATWVTSSR